MITILTISVFYMFYVIITAVHFPPITRTSFSVVLKTFLLLIFQFSSFKRIWRIFLWDFNNYNLCLEFIKIL